MKLKPIILSTFVAILFSGSTSIYAQHHEENADKSSPTHFSKHHIAIYNGLTTSITNELTGYTLGLDYEYRISQLLGVGVFGEYIFVESKEIVAGISVFVHPYKGLKIFAAPIIGFSEEEHEEDGGEGHVTEKETNIYFRTGLGYDFHIGKLSVGPSVNFDFGETKVIGYGLSIGFGF